MSFVASYLKRFLPRALGVISSDYTLLSIDTGINVAPGTGNTLTIAPPATPVPNVSVVINNTGTGTVIFSGPLQDGTSVSIPPQGSITVQWNGSYWIIVSYVGAIRVNAGSSTFGTVTIIPDWVVLNPECSYVLPASKINGTSTTGPFAAPPTVPADYTISTEITQFCGGILKHVVDISYAAVRSGSGFTYTNAQGVGGLPVSSAAAAWTGFYSSILNLSAWAAWNICPVVSGGSGHYVYYYDEPTYDAPDVYGNINIRSNTIGNVYSGAGISCAEVAARTSTSAVAYSANVSVLTALNATVYYLDATVRDYYVVI